MYSTVYYIYSYFPYEAIFGNKIISIIKKQNLQDKFDFKLATRFLKLIESNVLGIQKKQGAQFTQNRCVPGFIKVYQIIRLTLIIFMNYSGEKKIFLKTHRRIKTDINSNNNSQFRSSEISANRNRNIIHQSERYKTENREDGFSITQYRDSINNSYHFKNKNQLHSYNKWYIKPNLRLKQSFFHEMKPKEDNIEFAYNRLYDQDNVSTKSPFEREKNQKLKLLQKIPIHNMKLLQSFKKSQQSKKKRVPKIIQFFLKKKIN